MIKILFICHGNICRSPVAEFILKDMVKKRGLEGRVRIESAATHTDEIWNGDGSPVYPPAVSVLMEHGIGGPENELGLSRKRARLMERADYRRFDYLIGMDGANIVDMKKISGGDPDKKMFKMLEFAGRDGDVADPWYTRDFEAAWKDCNDGCKGLLDHIFPLF